MEEVDKCEYCDFKIKDYNDDYESTLGFNNRWSGANLLECTTTHEEVDAENGVLYEGKYYLSVGGDDEGFFEIHYCPVCGRKLEANAE